jgi:hypothetical protein
MGKASTTTTDNTSTSSTRPWEEAQPLLNNLFGQLGNVSGAPTNAQTTAGNNLVNAAGGIPDLSGSEIGTVKNLFNSNTQPQQDMLTGAYGDLKKNLSGYLDPSYLNPMSTPGFADALSTMKGDISNSVNGSFAAAGRDFSPANSTYVARGLSQGMGGLISDQFNKNVATQLGAAGMQFNGAGSTASGVTGQQQTQLGNGIQGLSAANGLGGLLTAPALMQLQAANTSAAVPLSNLGMLEQFGIPLAQLGQTTKGTGHSTGTQQASDAQQFNLYASGANNLLGAGSKLAGLL